MSACASKQEVLKVATLPYFKSVLWIPILVVKAVLDM